MKRHTWVTLAIALMVLGGCATNPYPVWTERGGGTSTLPATLDQALVQLQQDRSSVNGKLHELATAQIQSGNFMLGSGILSLIGAISGGHKDTILIPAVLGGSAYTFNRFNDRTVPSAIYKQALQAYDCIEASVTPYHLGKLHQGMLDRSLVSGNSRAMLTSAIGDASYERDLLAKMEPRNALLAKADDLIKQGRDVLKDVDTSRQNTHDLYARLERLPSVVAERLSSIRTVTNLALSDAQPKLDVIPALIADLPKQIAAIKAAPGYGAVIGIGQAESPEVKKRPEEDDNKAKQPAVDKADTLKLVLAKLARAIHETASDARELDAMFRAVASREDYDRLKACGIDKAAVQAMLALDLQPVEVSFKAGKGGQQDIQIVGGTPPYVLGTYAPPKGNLTVGPSPTMGAFTVAVDKDVEAQEIVIRVMDATGKPKQLQVHVK